MAEKIKENTFVHSQSIELFKSVLYICIYICDAAANKYSLILFDILLNFGSIVYRSRQDSEIIERGVERAEKSTEESRRVAYENKK